MFLITDHKPNQRWNANPLQLTMTAIYTVTAHFLDVSQLPHHHLTVQVQGPGTAYSYSYVYLADAQATFMLLQTAAAHF
jgi:hypothetical protein